MKLNMTIVADYIEGVEIIGTHLSSSIELDITRMHLYRTGMHIESDVIYVCGIDDMPPVPSDRLRLHMLCLGAVPERYDCPNVEYIEVANTDLASLFNAGTDVFSFFGIWGDRLKQACIRRADLTELGRIAFDLFQTDVLCYDDQDLVLFHIWPQGTELWAGYPVGDRAYLDDGYIQILSVDLLYQQVIKSRMPMVFPAGVFARDCLICNIFDDNRIIAHLTVDATARDLMPSDRSLIYHLSHYVCEALLKWNVLRFDSSEQFDHLLENLVLKGLSYQPEYDAYLAARGWDREDEYLIAKIAPKRGVYDEQLVAQDVLFYQHLFEHVYVYNVRMAYYLLVFNISKMDGVDLARRDFTNYLKKHYCACGFSSTMGGAEHLGLCGRQAAEALTYGRERDPKRDVYAFEDYVLDALVHNALGGVEPSYYFTEQFKSLLDYANENGNELLETLKTFLLCDCNVTQAANTLQIHKTTFYYRMQRIEEISGIDLRDFKTRAYITILLLMDPA